MDSLAIHMHGISKGLKCGEFSIPDIGEIMPAALMIQHLDGLTPSGCSYMNNWGCERLGTSVDEINAMGTAYYERYFLKEESAAIFTGMRHYLEAGDFDKQYNFFQRVKLHDSRTYTWCYTVLKIAKINIASQLTDKIILLSSPVQGMDRLIDKVNKTLDQDDYIRKHYRRFAELTNREKEIIALLANGRSTKDIADELFISSYTVSSHRKNIIRKTDCKSFAELLRFAIAFDLV